MDRLVWVVRPRERVELVMYRQAVRRGIAPVLLEQGSAVAYARAVRAAEKKRQA